MTLLNDAEWVRWSDREISRQCAVGAPLVGRLRSELTVTNYSERTFTTKHGTVATMNTGISGKRVSFVGCLLQFAKAGFGTVASGTPYPIVYIVHRWEKAPCFGVAVHIPRLPLRDPRQQCQGFLRLSCRPLAAFVNLAACARLYRSCHPPKGRLLSEALYLRTVDFDPANTRVGLKRSDSGMFR